jgi:hypothetical protein
MTIEEASLLLSNWLTQRPAEVAAQKAALDQYGKLFRPENIANLTEDQFKAHTPPCKTGGLQESKLHYFNHLQGFRCQFIRLSIRAQTGEKPFKTKAYTSGQSPPLLVC